MFQIIYVHDIFEGIDDPILPDTGGSVLDTKLVVTMLVTVQPSASYYNRVNICRVYRCFLQGGMIHY